MVVDHTVYISGQLGMDTATGQLVAGGVQAQAKQVRPSEMQFKLVKIKIQCYLAQI